MDNQTIPITSIQPSRQPLPRPQFSPDNPYWRPLMWIPAAYRPRLTARDFLYASIWEISRPFDVHGAYCCKAAMLLTLKVNRPFFGLKLREQFRYKERQDEA